MFDLETETCECISTRADVKNSVLTSDGRFLVNIVTNAKGGETSHDIWDLERRRPVVLNVKESKKKGPTVPVTVFAIDPAGQILLCVRPDRPGTVCVIQARD